MARRRVQGRPGGPVVEHASGWAHVDAGGVFVAWCPLQGAVFDPCGAVDVQHAWHDPARRAEIRRRIKAI